MDFKKIISNKKGVSGVDISVAMVVITIGMSIIISLLTIISQTTTKVNREIESVLLAKSVFEKINTLPYTEFLEAVKVSSNLHYYEVLGIETPPGFGLHIDIDPEIYGPGSTNEEVILANIRKKGEIHISYQMGSETKVDKYPFFKYFDRVSFLNKPDLSSTLVISNNQYSAATEFEAITHTGVGHEVIPESELDEWYEYPSDFKLGSFHNSQKYARRMNVDGFYDFFEWVPRYVLIDDNGHQTAKYLVGKTDYALEFFVKEIIAPNGGILAVTVSELVEQIGDTNHNDDVYGAWVDVSLP